MIKNTHRDLNIALINELAMIFNKMGINTEQVLQAASSKWDFMPFRRLQVDGTRILVMGLTLKETAPTCAIPASWTS